MSQLYDMLQDIVNLSDEDKLRLFKESYLELLPVFKEVDPRSSGQRRRQTVSWTPPRSE